MREYPVNFKARGENEDAEGRIWCVPGLIYSQIARYGSDYQQNFIKPSLGSGGSAKTEFES